VKKSQVLPFLGSLLLMVLSANLSGQTQTSTRAEAQQDKLSVALPAAEPQSQPAGQSLTDHLNSYLPDWLAFSGELRFRSAGIVGDFYRDSNDTYLLTRLRLNMTIKPASWLKFYFQGQDAHVVGAGRTSSLPPLQQDSMDLRLGYLQIGDLNQRRFQLRAGRLELAFGEERLIGPANWLNTPRSFDGAIGSLRGAGYRLEGFVASVVKIHDGQFNENTPGNKIYGFYGGFSELVPNATLEPYFFWRRQSGLVTETARPGIEHFATFGLRWAGKFATSADYDLDMAKQAGALGTDTISAWAGHWRIGYMFGDVKLKPRFVGEYNYASGDHNPKDGTRGTFDQLFPSGHDLYGLTDQVGWKNIHHVRAGMEVRPAGNWVLTARENVYWLADPHDALYNAASIVVARSSAGRAGKFVGHEADFIASYKLNRWTTVSGGFGHLFPGVFLKTLTPGRSYSYPYAAMTYTF
jgi:hypothetical protein